MWVPTLGVISTFQNAVFSPCYYSFNSVLTVQQLMCNDIIFQKTKCDFN